MLGSVVRQLALAVATLFAASVVVFFATNVLPGDVAQAVLGQQATPEMLETMRQQLGLDQPVARRYALWLSGFATGDLGKSLATGADVYAIIIPRLTNTLLLAAYAAIVGIPIALALGILSAAFSDGLFDRFVSSVSVFVVSIPEFAIALILVALFAVTWNFFPAVVHRPEWMSPSRALWQLFLPMVTLVGIIMAHLIRLTRASILDVLASPYVEFALLKGVPKRRILLRHALPNAIAPIVSIVALTLGYLISGVALVEVVFSYPGLGRLMIDSIAYRDYPLIQASAIIFCALYILFNTLSDLSGTLFGVPVRRR